MPEPIATAKTPKERVELYENEVRILRTGGFLQRTGDKTIPLSEITGLEFQKYWMTGGRAFLYFDQEGHSPPGMLLRGTFVPGMKHPNTVLLGKQHESEFELLKEEIEERIEVSADGEKGDQGKDKQSKGPDAAMEKLRERFAAGEIDEEEFKEKKEVLEE